MQTLTPSIVAVLAMAGLSQSPVCGQWTAVRLGEIESRAYATGPGVIGGTVGDPAAPAMWTGSGASWVLTPLSGGLGAGGHLFAVDGGMQGGDYEGRATIWNGTAKSRIDLHPASGYADSVVLDAWGGQQVGRAGEAALGRRHAAMWLGSAATFVDLHPASARQSEATATDGERQGGWIDSGFQGQRAVLWDGAPEPAVDLHPAGATASAVACMAPGVQGGWATINGEFHAALWAGTAESMVDLHPAGASWQSEVLAVTGSSQAGYAYFDVGSPAPHAGVWRGSAASFVDLHAFLPAGYTESAAEDMVQEGNTLRLVGWATRADGVSEAWIWTGNVCYANCDDSTAAPALNVADFTCYLQRFAAGEAYANCDGSTAAPVLNVADFTCFLQSFAAGCP